MDKKKEEELQVDKLCAAIEAVLFTIGEPLELKKIADAIEHDEATTKKIIHTMMDKYKDESRGIMIAEYDESYQLCTKTEEFEYIKRVAEQPRDYVLSDVQLEVLSIIAYKQPITRLEIEKIRGVSSDHAVNRLVEVGLIEENGRLNAPGRPILFATTKEFLKRFALSSLDDLPQAATEKLEDFKAEAEKELEIIGNESTDSTEQ